MTVTTREPMTAEQIAATYSPFRGLRFQSRQMRDAVAKILRARFLKSTDWIGAAIPEIRLRSFRNHQLHPEYVADYAGELETGFGNTQYMTNWPVLYTIESK